MGAPYSPSCRVRWMAKGGNQCFIWPKSKNYWPFQNIIRRYWHSTWNLLICVMTVIRNRPTYLYSRVCGGWRTVAVVCDVLPRCSFVWRPKVILIKRKIHIMLLFILIMPIMIPNGEYVCWWYYPIVMGVRRYTENNFHWHLRTAICPKECHWLYIYL